MKFCELAIGQEFLFNGHFFAWKRDDKSIQIPAWGVNGILAMYEDEIILEEHFVKKENELET